jgi:hypothetical protein
MLLETRNRVREFREQCFEITAPVSNESFELHTSLHL